MSGSDSDVSRTRGTLPRSGVIERMLRDVVREYQGSVKTADLTVNTVRGTVVTRLSLEKDFFKTAQWKGKSKAIIWDEVAKETISGDERYLQTKVEERETSERIEAQDSAQQPRPKKRKIKRSDGRDLSPDGKSNEESALSDVTDKHFGQSRPSVDNGNDDTSESELSVLIDDDPPLKKPRGKKGSRATDDSDSQKTRSSKARKNTTATTSAAAVTLDPDKEEIKRLQGWLVKCGVRKLWGKELAPYESSKAKIRHLREMLSSVGMTGRYSQDKARQIKEQRELAADLEAVQEGNKLWGTQADDGSGHEDHGDYGGGGKRRRPLAKGLQELDFISDEGSD